VTPLRKAYLVAAESAVRLIEDPAVVAAWTAPSALAGFTVGGLAHLVNSVGGIVVDVPYPMHDSYSGANFNAGVQRLNGKQALAFSRNRHDTPAGDFSRSQNQGRLLIAALTQFRKEFEKDPSVLLTWIAAGLRNVDTNLSIQQLVSLAFTALTIPGLSAHHTSSRMSGQARTNDIARLSTRRRSRARLRHARDPRRRGARRRGPSAPT